MKQISKNTSIIIDKISVIYVLSSSLFMSLYATYSPKIILAINIKISINHRIDQIISENNYKISNLKTKLSLLNPNNILEKGYTIVTDANGKVLNFKDIKIGEDIHVKFSDGKIKANVKEKE